MTSISTVKREVAKLRDELAPKKESCVGWLNEDGSVVFYGETFESREAFEQFMKSDPERFHAGMTVLLLTWSDPASGK